MEKKKENSKKKKNQHAMEKEETSLSLFIILFRSFMCRKGFQLITPDADL